METCSALDFGELSRLVVSECRRHGLVAPGFRSPPRRRDATRTLRRYPNGHWLVSVRSRGRRVSEVVEDMVDGVLRVNGLEGKAGEGWRQALLSSCIPAEPRAA